MYSKLPTMTQDAFPPADHRSDSSQGVARTLRAAVALELPIALWRQPDAAFAQGLVALEPPQPVTDVDFEQSARGFVLAPFSDDSPALFLPAHVVLHDAALEVAPELPPALRTAATAFLRAVESTPATRPDWYAAPPTDDRILDRDEFISLVSDAIAFIRTRHIAKVVVSRTAPVPLSADFDPAALFDALCRRYPDAFVSLVAVPGVGTWIGASPELLLRVQGAQLSTMALAGTQPRDGRAPGDVEWGAKEQVEQAMVAEYIRSVFQQAGVVGVSEKGPHTVAAGSVVHLQTRFEAPLPTDAPEQAANAVLERLHPTSAVCGMPRHQALQFIEAREGYDRGFYSGYLGPVHWNGQSTLYVNLRCLQLRKQSASLYVGAGVTADSDPAAEWQETELKARTVRDALADAQPVQATRP